MLDDKQPYRVAWTTNVNGAYQIECRRGRYCSGEASAYFKDRHLEMRFTSPAGTFAAAKFVEWSYGSGGELQEFVDEADASSQADYDMAEAIRSSWAWYEFPFDYGTVVRFDRLVIDTEKDTRRIAWTCLSRAIDREFRKRGALLLLKTFPLEYEGEVNDATRAAFDKRLSAMTRLYRHRLSALTLPGKWGAKGWMWRPLRFRFMPSENEEHSNDLVGAEGLY